MSARHFELQPPDLSRWRGGNGAVNGVWRFESGTPGRDVLVSALVHGNELCGAWAVADALAAGLRPRAGALTFMFANLDAFDRFDPAVPDASRFVDADMNRLWGAMPWTQTDESTWGAEHRRVRTLAPIVERSEWLLDLHSMHEPGEALGLVGPLSGHALSALGLGAPSLLVADAGHSAGCRMRDHGRYGRADEEGTFALLVECGFHGDPRSADVARDVMARFLVASGALGDEDLPRSWRKPDDPRGQRLLEVTHAVTVAAGAPAHFEREWTNGELVREAGTLVAWTGGAEVRTPYDDCVLIMPTLVHASPGATLLRFARASGRRRA